MVKISKEFIVCYLSVTVFSLNQEVSKHNQLLSLVLLFCFTNLCLKFQASWVVEAHDKLYDTMCGEGCVGNKSAHPTSGSKPVAM